VRTPEETLTLFKQALEKRRAYVRRRLHALDEAEKQERAEWKGLRGRPPETYKGRIAMRGGMLSELTTITAMLKQIEAGTLHPDDIYNEEDDPKEPC
jgi:hypothetical protein